MLKKDSHHDLVEALATINKGEIYLSDEINQILTKALNHNTEIESLTKKELQILKLIADNYTISEIAKHLSVSERTVESHRKHLLIKTKTSSNVGLLKYAYANNLI